MLTIDEIGKLVKKELRPRTEKLLKVHKRETDELRRAMLKQLEAIEKKDERGIQLHTKTIEIETKQLALRLSQAAELQREILAIEPLEDFGPHLKEIEKLSAALAEVERKLTKNFKAAKESIDRGRDAMEADDATVDGDEVAKEWAIVGAHLNSVLKLENQRLAKLEKVHDQARKALNKRDRSTLVRVVKATVTLRDQAEPFKKLAKDFGDHWKKFDPNKLPKKLRQQFDRDQKDNHSRLTEISRVQHSAAEIVKEILSIQLPEPNVKKAAKLFNIPSSYMGKFGKALAVPPNDLLKSLERVARDLKLDQTAKQMLRALERAKIF